MCPICPGSDSVGPRPSVDTNTRCLKAQLDAVEIARKYSNDAHAQSNTHEINEALQKYGNGVDGTDQ